MYWAALHRYHPPRPNGSGGAAWNAAVAGSIPRGRAERLSWKDMKGRGAQRRVSGGTEVATRSAVFQKEMSQLALEK